MKMRSFSTLYIAPLWPETVHVSQSNPLSKGTSEQVTLFINYFAFICSFYGVQYVQLALYCIDAASNVVMSPLS